MFHAFKLSLLHWILPWLIWATYNSFPKISEKRWEIGQKTRDRVKFYVVACFTSNSVFWFPIFQETEISRPHEILQDNTRPWVWVIDILLLFSLLSEMLLQNNFEPQKRGQIQLLSNNLNMNKKLMVFLLNVSLNFLSDKLIFSCSVKRC